MGIYLITAGAILLIAGICLFVAGYIVLKSAMQTRAYWHNKERERKEAENKIRWAVHGGQS